MPGLRLNNISKSFKDRKVIDRVSLEIAEGELLVVLGPSGCGKSTLLRLITGLEEVDDGEIWIGERRVDSLPPQKRNVALVFQNYALYPHMTVAQNLAFPLKVARSPRAEIKERVEKTAAMIGLGDRLEARPAELSGGQRQRVALGRAIIRKPDMFLLDEPLSNLDADLRARMRRDIVALQKELGVTTVYVTHDQVEAMTMADRIAVINEGRLCQVGTVNEIYDYPQSTFVAGFLGAPRINLVEADIYQSYIQPFNIPLESLPYKFESNSLLIGLRPELILINSGGPFAAIVETVEFLGSRSIVTLKYGELYLTALADGISFGRGEPVRFEISTPRLLFFDKTTGQRYK